MPPSVALHPHARERAQKQGVTEPEIIATVSAGERRSAKHNRISFRRNFTFGDLWRGRVCYKAGSRGSQFKNEAAGL